MNARRGIENPFAWCIDNDRAYLLTNNRISPIIGYIRRHFDPDADYLLAKQIDDHSFYRIVTKNPKPGIESDVIDAPAPNLRAEDVSFSRSGRNLNVSGRVWLEGTSSYRGEAWLELAGDDGKTRFRLMTQYEAEAPDADGAPPGDLHGQFSKYTVSCTLPKRFSGRASILYRSGDAWYRVPVADLDE